MLASLCGVRSNTNIKKYDYLKWIALYYNKFWELWEVKIRIICDALVYSVSPLPPIPSLFYLA